MDAALIMVCRQKGSVHFKRGKETDREACTSRGCVFVSSAAAAAAEGDNFKS